MCMWYSLLQHTYVLIHYKHVSNTISRKVFLYLSIHRSTLLLYGYSIRYIHYCLFNLYFSWHNFWQSMTHNTSENSLWDKCVIIKYLDINSCTMLSYVSKQKREIYACEYSITIGCTLIEAVWQWVYVNLQKAQQYEVIN